MNNPVFPLLGELANLGQAFLDKAAQKNWTEIEDLEKGEGALESHAKRQLAGTSLTTNTTTTALSDAFTRIQPITPAESEAVTPLSEMLDRDAVGGISSDDVHGEESVDGLADDRAAPSISARSVPVSAQAQTLATSSFSAVEALTAADIDLPSAPALAAGAGQVTAAAASGIEHSLASSGSFIAAQKLHAAVRSMSPEQVSALLDRAGGAIATMFEQTVKGEDRSGKSEEKQREVRIALALAHVAAAIDKDPRNPSSIRLVQDICAIVLATATPNDNATFAGLAQAIGVGAGARLALAVATELAHHDEDPSRAPGLMTLVLAGFMRLGERVEQAYADVLHLAGPLCLEWARWRGDGEENAIRALIDLLRGQPSMLPALEPQLQRLEQAGLEAFRAVRDLSAYSFDSKFRKVHSQFLENQSIFASIAGSRTALSDISHHALATNDGVHEGAILDAVRLTLTHIGFDAPRAAFLADRSQLGRSALMLGSNWTELESFENIALQGRVFQRFLTFLNGQYFVATTPEIIRFDDRDMQI